MFTIQDTVYFAEQGMTFEQWVNSKYNTDFYLEGGDLGAVIHNGDDYAISMDGIAICYATDTIFDGYKYSAV